MDSRRGTGDSWPPSGSSAATAGEGFGPALAANAAIAQAEALLKDRERELAQARTAVNKLRVAARSASLVVAAPSTYLPSIGSARVPRTKCEECSHGLGLMMQLMIKWVAELADAVEESEEVESQTPRIMDTVAVTLDAALRRIQAVADTLHAGCGQRHGHDPVMARRIGLAFHPVVQSQHPSDTQSSSSSSSVVPPPPAKRQRLASNGSLSGSGSGGSWGGRAVAGGNVAAIGAKVAAIGAEPPSPGMTTTTSSSGAYPVDMLATKEMAEMQGWRACHLCHATVPGDPGAICSGTICAGILDNGLVQWKKECDAYYCASCLLGDTSLFGEVPVTTVARTSWNCPMCRFVCRCKACKALYEGTYSAAYELYRPKDMYPSL